MHTDGGCSRTNPVTWLGVTGQNVQVQVKREPQHVHVSELVAVKLEQASPGTKPEHPPPVIPASLNNGKSRYLLANYARLVLSYRTSVRQRWNVVCKFFFVALFVLYS